MEDSAPTTYWDYIRIEELLALQGGREHDEAQLGNEEVLFITVHQIFELWFKLLLRDLASTRDVFTADPVAEQELAGAVSRLSRMAVILRSATQHFEVVETIGTRAYLEFRNKLLPASGFQSAQMRQIEILLGLEESERIPLGPIGSHLDALRGPRGERTSALERVEAALNDRPTLRDAVHAWLYRTPIDGTAHDAPDADERLQVFIERFLEAHGREVQRTCDRAVEIATGADEVTRLRARYAAERDSVRAFLLPESGDRHLTRVRAAMVFIETYRDLPLLAWPREILAALLHFEQAFSIFRQRHARMVELVIGRRVGTGGSSGVDYLDQTALSYRVFRDLWAIRTLMIRPGAAPPLANPSFYGFRSGV